ncbi:BRCA1-associated RING domain protein 1-like isoform X2 [Gigantopelta aegis]|uniref:BRCA1-associated RING domain protein 1-like isoform X2 n=1 Tax=Gigantopelta aegis TaxID=1735272 RepID=UPI001B887B13|nr:BRCA1-associated RING domain protein 1-like isoform X2 [Gigantopelta aegis]
MFVWTTHPKLYYPNTLPEELFTLGGCEHKFCRSCCENIGGNSCPVCSIPVHVKDVQINRQLSNLVTLCLELRQILDTDVNYRASPSASQSSVTELKYTPQAHVRSNSSVSFLNSSADVTNSSPSLSNVNPKTNSPNATAKENKLKSVYDFVSSPDTPRRHKVERDTIKRKKPGLVTRQRCVNKPQTQATAENKVHTPRYRIRSGPCDQQTVLLDRNKSDTKRRHSLSSHVLPRGKKRSPVFSGSPLSRKKRPASQGAVISSPCGSQVKRNTKGESPLHVAAIKGQTDVVQHLLKEGANPNVRDNAGWTPLHESCNHGYTRIAELLLDHGAVMSMPGMENDTPLHDAVMNYRIECVALLVSRGASLTARNIHGLTPVDYARTDAMKEALRTQVTRQETTTQEVDEVDECQVLYFTATSMSRDQKIHLHKCASKLNAKVVEDLQPEVSHVITSCNDGGMCPRTLKYLHAVLAGKWIVSINWLDICVEYGKAMLEEAFEVAGSSTHPGSRAAYKGRMNRKQQLPGLFDGCQLYFHGSFVYPTPEKSELINLVKCGGGQILTREPKVQNLDDYDVTVPYHTAPDGPLANCGLFIIFDNNAVLPSIESCRVCAVRANWIINSIATFSLLDPYSKS